MEDCGRTESEEKLKKMVDKWLYHDAYEIEEGWVDMELNAEDEEAGYEDSRDAIFGICQDIKRRGEVAARPDGPEIPSLELKDLAEQIRWGGEEGKVAFQLLKKFKDERQTVAKLIATGDKVVISAARVVQQDDRTEKIVEKEDKDEDLVVVELPRPSTGSWEKDEILEMYKRAMKKLVGPLS